MRRVGPNRTAASDVTQTTATVTGAANGNGAPGTAVFEYGTSTAYAASVPAGGVVWFDDFIWIPSQTGDLVIFASGGFSASNKVDIESGDGLALGVFGVGGGITDDAVDDHTGRRGRRSSA